MPRVLSNRCWPRLHPLRDALPLTGIDGCGYEHPLEAGLKALWPASNDAVSFRADAFGMGGEGHGEGANAGFLRDDSLLVVVVVSDEDDCSAEDQHIFTPADFLDASNPADAELASQGANLRCYYNKAALHPIDRYVDGLKALRPDNENVIFATIAGVPLNLLTEGAGATFGTSEEREAFYARVLNDERMIETPDPNRPPGGDWNEGLLPSCESEHAKAEPPRRLVEVARAFGENGVVGSICSDSFGGMTGAIIRAVSTRMIESDLAAQAATASTKDAG